MGFATRLREATWASHQSAEARAWQRALARGAAAPERLGVYLAQLHAVHAALERAADADREWVAALGWCDTMRHTRRLEQDLAQLDAAGAPTLPATRALLIEVAARLAVEPSALLGLLYVLEGSMNGNRFLVRALRRGPAAARCSLAYFYPYGDEQPARWAAFKAGLDRIALGPEEESAAIAAALAAFDGIGAISEEMMVEMPAVARFAGNVPPRAQARIPCTTSPATSVRRKSRP